MQFSLLGLCTNSLSIRALLCATSVFSVSLWLMNSEQKHTTETQRTEVAQRNPEPGLLVQSSLLGTILGTMPHYIDLDTWPRRAVFEFYLPFDKPYFNVCVQLDVTKLISELKKREKTSLWLTYHYFALKAANEIEPFRYRLRQGKVLVHDVINV